MIIIHYKNIFKKSNTDYQYTKLLEIKRFSDFVTKNKSILSKEQWENIKNDMYEDIPK